MVSKDDKVFGFIKVECHSVQVYCIFQLTSERVSGIFFSMEEKGLGAVLSKNDKVFGFFKAVPPPIIITQSRGLAERGQEEEEENERH